MGQLAVLEKGYLYTVAYMNTEVLANHPSGAAADVLGIIPYSNGYDQGIFQGVSILYF